MLGLPRTRCSSAYAPHQRLRSWICTFWDCPYKWAEPHTSWRIHRTFQASSASAKSRIDVPTWEWGWPLGRRAPKEQIPSSSWRWSIWERRLSEAENVLGLSRTCNTILQSPVLFSPYPIFELLNNVIVNRCFITYHIICQYSIDTILLKRCHPFQCILLMRL